MEFLIGVGGMTIAAIIGAYFLLRAEKKEKETA
jgi:hypothetical protein